MRRVTFVVFGGTGDLVRERLILEIASLIKNLKLSKDSLIVGVGRRDFNDTKYRDFLYKYIKNKIEKPLWKKLNIYYYKANYVDKGSLKELGSYLQKLEPQTTNNRIYYIATSYDFIYTIVNQLNKYRLSRHPTMFRRIVLEKPWGTSLGSAKKINDLVHECFSEEQVYRIDHYMAKPMIKHLLGFRKMNPLFELTWNSSFIEQIIVFSDERIGVGKRMNYYNKTGAIIDMIQNHLLQVASVVLMDLPDNKQGQHEKKLGLIQKLVPGKQIVIGQYESYAKEANAIGISDTSTETYAEVELQCKNKRWASTRIYLRTGKMLNKKQAKIEILYRLPKPGEVLSHSNAPNKFIIDIQPIQGMSLEVNIQPPNESQSKVCKVCKGTDYKVDTGEYADLLLDCINGDRSLFLRENELMELWRITEELLEFKSQSKLKIYKDNSDGPDVL